jgi:antitoxin component YwqK of YwqJK toxin-antitoxin module
MLNMKNILTILFLTLNFSVFSQVKYEAGETNFLDFNNNGYVYTLKDKKPVTGIVYILHDNGELDIEAHYKNGKEHGKNRCWFKNGKLNWEYTSIDGKLDGTYKVWYENGQLKFEQKYILGKEDGNSKEWYENGQLKSEYNYSNGKRVGWQKYYSNTGTSLGICFLKGGNGHLIFYHENGEMYQDILFEDGMKNGVVKSWYSNGQLSAETEYFRDVINGYSTSYYENGIMSVKEYYIAGVFISGQCWDSEGVEYECGNF